jgi:hypothetical protein
VPKAVQTAVKESKKTAANESEKTAVKGDSSSKG